MLAASNPAMIRTRLTTPPVPWQGDRDTDPLTCNIAGLKRSAAVSKQRSGRTFYAKWKPPKTRTERSFDVIHRNPFRSEFHRYTVSRRRRCEGSVPWLLLS